MSEETRKVLEMLSNGKITVQEAEQLLTAVNVASQNEEKKAEPRYFRILVNKPAHDGKKAENVNIKYRSLWCAVDCALARFFPPSSARKNPAGRRHRARSLEDSLHGSRGDDQGYWRAHGRCGRRCAGPDPLRVMAYQLPKHQPPRESVQKETMVTTPSEGAAFVPLTREDFEAAYAKVSPHIHHTPLLSSRLLSEATGFDARLKAEMFQRTGSYKIRGPLNKFTYLTEEERRRGVVCSSAGNHAQGVALAAKIHGIKAVVVHGRERDALQDRGDARVWRGSRPARHDLGRGQRESEGAGARARPDLCAPVRRHAADRRPGHDGAGDHAATGPTSMSSSCRSAAAG